jgi:hypothetical protein
MSGNSVFNSFLGFPGLWSLVVYVYPLSYVIPDHFFAVRLFSEAEISCFGHEPPIPSIPVDCEVVASRIL